MSEFKVEIVEVTIKEHPNADRLEIAEIEGFQSIVGKDQYTTGDLVAYIPEQAIVPDDLLEEMGLKGRLAGSQKNRVKPVRLRGVFSEGLCYPAKDGWKLGQDVAEELGITKWKPPVPKQLKGEVYSAGHKRAVKYDIENFKKYPREIKKDEPVVITEKIHGDWAQLGMLSEENAHEEYGRLAVISKGLGSKGLLFKPDAENNKNNVYLKMAKRLDIENRLGHMDSNVFVLGEIYGVQDLKYDADKDMGFRVFDVFVGEPSGAKKGRYFNHDELNEFCDRYGFERVPVLYEGPFSKEKMLELTDGPETVSGEQQHIREGVVVRPQNERNSDRLRRVQLKSVSEHYLERSGGTEYS